MRPFMVYRSSEHLMFQGVVVMDCGQTKFCHLGPRFARTLSDWNDPRPGPGQLIVSEWFFLSTSIQKQSGR